MKQCKRPIILIVDDSEMNRSILAEMLGDAFSIMEAGDGQQALTIMKEHYTKISLLLLDINMPVMSGFDVLKAMKSEGYHEFFPTIMITAEDSHDYLKQAYEMGVADYINRPFDMYIVKRRVINIIMLYAKQRRMEDMLYEQIYEKQKSNNMMINILSHIVEFRNGESGLHVVHIQSLTRMFLNYLITITDAYPLTKEKISLITVASALHDIGKIAIPDEILNKPGRLTKEEFEVIKTHSKAGADILKQVPFYQDEPLIMTAYEICLNHHERYDGKGYPAGKKGEEIPISAQVVALADVYDALTSERVYKAAYDHDKAVAMIANGECGAFQPLLIKCLQDLSEDIRKAVRTTS